MKLAFNGQAHYTDFTDGYNLYVKRARGNAPLSLDVYKRVLKRYCKLLAERLIRNGIVDLPKTLGTIASAIITRRPQYRGKQFIGYGAIDWSNGRYDGKLKTFGIVYLPRHDKNQNLRCLGFVANRRLFQAVKAEYVNDNCTWQPVEFNDEMI